MLFSKDKLTLFYAEYSRYLTYEGLLCIIFAVLEANNGFDLPNNITDDEIYLKMFKDLNSSHKYGIGKSLTRIMQKYNLSLDETESLLRLVVEYFHSKGLYKGIKSGNVVLS